MSRYIDAELCRRRISDERTDDKRWNEALNRACRIVCEQPTVDAVEVVRCKECVYWNDRETNKKGFVVCKASHMDCTEYDYCSFGEKVTE